MWFALGARGVGGRLPWPVQRGLGWAIGAVALRVAGARRRAAQINLALCFPEMTPGERDRLLRESFHDLGIGFFEFARAWWGSVGPMRRTVGIEGLEKLEAIPRLHGRTILMTGDHLPALGDELEKRPHLNKPFDLTEVLRLVEALGR